MAGERPVWSLIGQVLATSGRCSIARAAEAWTPTAGVQALADWAQALRCECRRRFSDHQCKHIHAKPAPFRTVTSPTCLVMTEASGEDLKPFASLDEYQVPAMPTDESLRRAGWKLWRWCSSESKEDPFIAGDSLDLADQTQLDRLVAPPACGPLLDELSLTFRDWIRDSPASNRVQLVVLPPCDRNDVLQTWAESNGHVALVPPDRKSLLSASSKNIQLEETDDLIVIPRLERWFLRHTNGLDAIEKLLEQMESCGQRFLIGCGSWAHAFLSKAIQTDLVFPTGLTFHPYGSQRLHQWFSRLADVDASRRNEFRFADSGKSIFGENAPQKQVDEHFATLAAHSRGIPWVAWHLWRQSLKLGPDRDAEIDQKFPEERTIWVSALREFSMPSDEVDAGLLILHSLLIHDRLTPNELAATVPGIQQTNVLPALLKAGLIHRQLDGFCCDPAAYPAIRQQLVEAGFPVDSF